MDRASVRYSFLGFNVKIIKIFPKKKIKFIDIIRKNEYSLF